MKLNKILVVIGALLIVCGLVLNFTTKKEDKDTDIKSTKYVKLKDYKNLPKICK